VSWQTAVEIESGASCGWDAPLGFSE